MLRQYLVLLVSVGVCWSQSSPELVDFSERFAEHSCMVQPKLNDLSVQNAHVRLELIRWIVAEIGNLTVDMRDLTADTWAQMEKHELMSEDECRDTMRGLRDYYVYIGELDIMYCAYDMDYYMRHDSIYRFTPRAQYVNQENSRAIFQTVQTLGRNNFLANMSDVLCELQDALEYYQNLWTSYKEVLHAEIEYIEPLEELVRDEMSWWYNYAIYWHTLFMGLLKESIEYYC